MENGVAGAGAASADRSSTGGAGDIEGVSAMTWDPSYVIADGWTVHCYKLSSGNVLRFAARDLRRERSGVHAKIAVSMNWVTLAWSNFNIDRDEDRVRLANSAYGHLDGEAHALDTTEFPKPIFKHALDLFCLDLWSYQVSGQVGGMMEGDPTIPPAKLLLGSYIIDGGGTIIFAPPGAGKSYTAQSMAVSLAYGKEHLWTITDARLGLYINVERSAPSMAARLARINRALGLDPRAPIPFLNARGKTLADIYEAAQRTIEQEGCSVVFYDSISRAGFGSLVGDDTANRIMDMLNALSPTWVALAHSPRADDSHAFGSQMFDAAADLTVQLQSQTSSDGLSTGIGLQVIKANDIRKPAMEVHVLEWDLDGLANIRKGQRGEFAELEAGEHRSKENLARDYLLQLGAATAGQVADHFGWNRGHTSSLLNAATTKWASKQARGKEVYYAVRSERLES